MKTNPILLNLLLTLTLLTGQTKPDPDPDPIQDYCIASSLSQSHQQIFLNGITCKNPTEAKVSDFTTSKLSKPGNNNTRVNPLMTNITFTTTTNLPGLNTMGLTMARIDFGPSGIVPPHVHPRASEVTVCLNGVILVGFVDTLGRVFTQELHFGESFVFPKGLIHFLYNIDSVDSAFVVSGFSSQNPGTQFVSLDLFTLKLLVPKEVFKRLVQINDLDKTNSENIEA